MAEEGLKSANACKVLKVSVAFVSNRKIIYENKGAECLRSVYKGSKGYLSFDSDKLKWYFTQFI